MSPWHRQIYIYYIFKQQRIQVLQQLVDVCREIKICTLDACHKALHVKLIKTGFRDPESTPEGHEHKLTSDETNFCDEDGNQYAQ